MCELLGFTSTKKTDISNYLRTFFSHSVQNPHVQEKSPRISLNAQSDCSLGQRLCVNYSTRILKSLGFAKIVGISD